MKATKDIILKNIRNLFQNEGEENYDKLVRVSNWSCNYIGYESNKIEIKHYQLKNINEITPHLKDTINNLKKSETWKIHLTIVNNLIFFS